jgi:hypothetical protein
MDKQAARRGAARRPMERAIFINATGELCEMNNCNLLDQRFTDTARKLQLQFSTARCTARRAHYLKYTGARTTGPE